MNSLDELVELAIEPTLEVALRAVREMLGMQVAYISEIMGGEMVLRESRARESRSGSSRGCRCLWRTPTASACSRVGFRT
jgi:hypothetical protein